MKNATSPATYTAAVAVAEIVTIEELAALVLEANGNVTVFKHRSPRTHAVNARLSVGSAGRSAWLSYERCGRTGFNATGMVSLRRDAPVFDLYNLGRIVRVA